MKKLLSLVLVLLLMMTTASALDVPRTTTNLPNMFHAPDAPQIIRVQKDDAAVTITLDRELPEESLVTMLGLDADCRLVSINAVPDGDNTHTAVGLPEGGQWTGFEIAWVDGDINAMARYNAAGGLESSTRFDEYLCEYVYDSQGQFYEFGSAYEPVRARFNPNGKLTCYGYKAYANTYVWFNLQGDILWADYNDGEFAASWQPDYNWYVNTPSGRVKVQLNLSPWGTQPLFVEEDDQEEEEPEKTWYPNNTIGLAGLSLQEASASLPNKWYNVIPVDLTHEGRQTYFLVISNALFIGECYVDVWDGQVTVSYDLIENTAIEPLESYGRWFTSLSQINAQSIESKEDGFLFGEPVDIEGELDGAAVALLFIRSKATYYLPFSDGTALAEYWRNKAEWKEFRKDLQELMVYVEK